MAMTVAECRRMTQVCRDHGVQLIIAYYRRYFPVVRKMKALIAAGTIGRPLRARAAVADYYTPRADGERSWLTEPDTAGGGFLTDVATHRLDLLTFFLGKIQSVSAFVDTQHFDFPVDDASVLAMRFANGTHATGAFNWNVGAPIDEFEVCGTKGRLVARNLFANAGELDVHVGKDVEHHHLPAPAITHLGLVEHFVECLLTGQPNTLPGEEGMQATRITEAAYRSAREGTVVSLD
jgi:predicted dehydrogenase